MKKCNVLNAMGLFGKKWTFVIVEQISLHNNSGFNPLLKKIKNISPKVLSSRLKDLEERGLIINNIENSLRSRYILSQKGEEIFKILKELKLWNSKYSENCYNKECADCELLN